MKIQGRSASLGFVAALVTMVTFASAAAPLHAAELEASAKTRSISVPHRDLDLNSEAGLRQLNARVRNAAENICVEVGKPPLQAKFAARDCVEQAVASATSAVLVAAAQQRRAQFASRASASE